MSTTKEIVMTEAGLQALEAELEELKTTRRTDVAEKIKIARGYGDLSENSEYDEAKNEQAQIESRISEIEAMLKYVKIIDNENLSLDTVSVGTHIKVVDEDGEEEEYDITGSAEADPLNGRISDESPVGAGLVGKRAGDVADITLPNGCVIQYKVLEITRAEL